MQMSIKIPDLKIGADPEFFLMKNNVPFSAHPFIQNGKRDPLKLSKGAVQLDGTALEFNIDPASTSEEFVDNIESTLGEIRGMVPKSYKFHFFPCVIYDKKYFDDVVPEDSKVLGCDPDFSALTGEQNNPPDPIGQLRTGAGHIHFGWTNDADVDDEFHRFDCERMALNIDRVFRIASKVWDIDRTRSLMYGANAAYRPKPYGLEYRSLSNAWLRYPKLWPWLFDTCQKTFEYMVKHQVSVPEPYVGLTKSKDVRTRIDKYNNSRTVQTMNLPPIPQDFYHTKKGDKCYGS